MPSGATPEPTSRVPRFLRRHHRSRDGQLLVVESESFLSGHMAGVFRRGDAPPPAWVEINWLAHRAPEALVEIVRGDVDGDSPYGSWAWAVRLLARSVVEETAGHVEGITHVQRHCIIPMELALMTSSGTSLLPTHLVALGVPKIRRCARQLRGLQDW